MALLPSDKFSGTLLFLLLFLLTPSVVLNGLGSQHAADVDSPVTALAGGCDCGPWPRSPFVACSCRVVLTEIEPQKWLGGSDTAICHVVLDEP